MTGSTFKIERKEWKPHDYQLRAITKMLQQHAVGLFMDPGLGKTSTVLQAFIMLKNAGLVDKMLVVAPIRPMYNVWPAEIEKWSNFNHLTYNIIHGDKKEEKLDWPADVYLINPEAIPWLFNTVRRKRSVLTDTKKLDRMGVDCLCVDESTRFKTSSSVRFMSIKKHLSNFKMRWCLTGTPTPNGISDLFGQIYLLDLGRALGAYITHFRARYMYPHPEHRFQFIAQEDAFQRVTEKVKPLVVQLSAKDWLKMPELINNTVLVELPPAAMLIYKEVEEEFIAHLEDGTVLASNAGVAGTKCRQIANGAVYSELVDDPEAKWIWVHDAKLDALEELLEELGDKPVLLVYEYRHDAERIMERIPHAQNITGASHKKVDMLINGFNTGSIPILLGHPASMGHGLNLQGACNNVIMFGITWNLEHYQQVIARVYRQGQQEESVIVHHFVAKGTLDHRVMNVLASKDSDQQRLLSALAPD